MQTKLKNSVRIMIDYDVLQFLPEESVCADENG